MGDGAWRYWVDEQDRRFWTVLGEELLLSRRPYVEVSVQRVRLPDGREIPDFYQVRMQDYALIFPVMEDGRILVLRGYRHGVRGICLGFPGGHMAPGEAPLTAAQRELLEEAGLAAEHWEPLGSFVTSENHRCQTVHFFRALGCKKVALPESGDLEEVELVELDETRLWDALERGEIASLSQASLLALASRRPEKQNRM